jgi:glutamate-1-semialdehyde aminotransferase/acyl carrier protein
MMQRLCLTAASLDDLRSALDTPPEPRIGDRALILALSDLDHMARDAIAATLPGLAERYEAALSRLPHDPRAEALVFNAAFLQTLSAARLEPDLLLLAGTGAWLTTLDPIAPENRDRLREALQAGAPAPGVGLTGEAAVFLLDDQRLLDPRKGVAPVPMSTESALATALVGERQLLILVLGLALPTAVGHEVFVPAAQQTPGQAVARWIARSFEAGRPVDFSALQGAHKPGRIALPTYPFERSRHWIDPASPRTPQDRPHEANRARILRILRELAPEPLEDVKLGQQFLDLGFDSLTLSQLAGRLKRECGIEIEFSELATEGWTPERLCGLAATATVDEASPTASHGPFRAEHKRARAKLTRRQRAFVEDLSARMAQSHRRSKALALDTRVVHCDPRSAAGFDPRWKALVFPIAAAHSTGSHLEDVDGNRYVDMVMGFGANYLGHAPGFVTEALYAQIDDGYALGPQTPLAAEVAQRVARITGVERVAFCNTGSEAVAAALRLARTATGRDTVAAFRGAYHGGFDAVLGRAPAGEATGKAIPVAPGIPASALQDMRLLDYASDAALDFIDAHGGSLAAVLVEPVQARAPQTVPVEFLHSLRALCDRHGIALIFDEVITGFRCHLGGAQALFGLQADLALYGKVLGGGLPIGAVAGRARFMDHIDGGPWRYGDASVPAAARTFFAGTFVRHPLAMAAAKAALDHLEMHGNALQVATTARVLDLTDRLNTAFRRHGAPINANSFASFIALTFDPGAPGADLLFPLLRTKGIYADTGRLGHFSIAHTDADMAAIARAFEESLQELSDHGFLHDDSDRAPAFPKARHL